MVSTRQSEWIALAESSDPMFDASRVLTGEVGREATRALLMEATGAKTEEQMIRLALGGRPSLDATEPAGASPMWKVRASTSLDSDARAQAAREGRSLSDIIRDSVRAYLREHAAA